MLIMLILLIWWLFLCSFASNMTFNSSVSKFLHSSTSTGTKSQSGRHQNSLVLFCYPNWQWVSSTVDWIPLCLGWKCLQSTAGKEKKKKKEPERRFLFISRWKLCWLSQFAQHIRRPGLFVCTSEGHIWSRGDWFRWFSSVFCYSMSVFFFFRGLLGSWTTVRIQEFGSVLVLVSWSFLK